MVAINAFAGNVCLQCSIIHPSMIFVAQSVRISVSQTTFIGGDYKNVHPAIANGVSARSTKSFTAPSSRSRAVFFPSANLHIPAAANNSSKKFASRHPASVVERAAELLAKQEQEKPHNNNNGIRKTADLHVDLDFASGTADRLSKDRLTPTEVKKFATQLEQTYRKSPTVSPKEILGEEWREYHGSDNWEGLLEPLHPNLRREIVKYGEFAQATYDAFDFDAHSRYCGSCRYNRHKMLEKVELHQTGYKITKYLYAMSDVHLPKFFGRSNSMDPWSKDSNWMGYVGVCSDGEAKRLGRRDIVVAWRGTVTQLEWMENLRDILHPVGDLSSPGNSSVKVERGFLSLYTSNNDNTRYNKLSASEQAMHELRRLVEMYTELGEEVSITVTGHSLGGALALLNAYEIAAKKVNVRKDGRGKIPVTVFSFGAPRVGNSAFRHKLEEMGVKALRVVCKKDMVPKMPGIIFNEGMEKYEKVIGPLLEALPWTYEHVGVELQLDHKKSPYLKHNLELDPAGCHSLEGYLHLLDGHESASAPFRARAKRDVALVNKGSEMVRKELMVPGNWYQQEHKGLVRNAYGRWVQPERHVDDIPSPQHVAISPHTSLSFSY